MIKMGKMNYKEIQEIVDYDSNLTNHNIEQLSAKLLFDLTRNTGFEVTKSTLGECWKLNCCDWKNKQEDDVCGLEETKPSIESKMRSIYLGTSLCTEFSNIGLEVCV